MLTPYASGKRWTLYAGDCREIAPSIAGIDAVIGDPPYGMDWDVDSARYSGGVKGHARGPGGARVSTPLVERLPVAGDTEPFDPSPWLDYDRVVLFGSNHFGQRLPVGTTLVWLKRNPPAFGPFLSDGELAWMKGGHGLYAHLEPFTTPNRSHPNEKPIGLMTWAMMRARVPDDALVFDGWCGSGTTGEAALRSGRRFVGCEIEPAYLPGIARRLSQAEADGVQSPMFGATA